jgi:hypothetical protein
MLVIEANVQPSSLFLTRFDSGKRRSISKTIPMTPESSSLERSKSFPHLSNCGSLSPDWRRPKPPSRSSTLLESVFPPRTRSGLPPVDSPNRLLPLNQPTSRPKMTMMLEWRDRRSYQPRSTGSWLLPSSHLPPIKSFCRESSGCRKRKFARETEVPSLLRLLSRPRFISRWKRRTGRLSGWRMPNEPKRVDSTKSLVLVSSSCLKRSPIRHRSGETLQTLRRHTVPRKFSSSPSYRVKLMM